MITPEDELLHLISGSLPQSIFSRKVDLDEKAETFSLSPAEIEERQLLMTRMERWQIARLEAVIQLAELRGETPAKIMKTLGILPR